MDETCFCNDATVGDCKLGSKHNYCCLNCESYCEKKEHDGENCNTDFSYSVFCCHEDDDKKDGGYKSNHRG